MTARAEPRLHETLPARSRTDVFVAQAMARRFVRRIGWLQPTDVAAAIVAGELTSNVVRHAGEGWFEISAHGSQLILATRDRGSRGAIPAPFLEPSKQAPTSVDERGRPLSGLGCGLGAVRRLCDRFEVERAPHEQLWVRAIFDRRSAG